MKNKKPETDLLPNKVLIKVPPNRLKKKPIKGTATYRYKFLCRNYTAKVCTLPDKTSNARLRKHDIVFMHPNTHFQVHKDDFYIVSLYDIESISIWKQSFEGDF